MKGRNTSKCPHCGSASWVVEARPTHSGPRRRRECYSRECRWRWSTLEVDLDVVRGVLHSHDLAEKILKPHTPEPQDK